jgi:hypothetical protein
MRIAIFHDLGPEPIPFGLYLSARERITRILRLVIFDNFYSYSAGATRDNKVGGILRDNLSPKSDNF